MLVGATAASAQGASGKSDSALLAPDEILLYAHKELKKHGFH
jgi:hypothetical protein